MWRKERLADADVFYKNNAFSALVRRVSSGRKTCLCKKSFGPGSATSRRAMAMIESALFDAAGNKWMMVSDTEEPLSTRYASEGP